MVTTIVKDPAPPATLTILSPPPAVVDGTVLITTLGWNRLIDIIDGVSVDKIPNTALDDIAQSKVTGLVAALAGKQATLSGLTITAATVTATDKVLIQDTDDSDNLKTVTAQSIADLAGFSQAEMDDKVSKTLDDTITGIKTLANYTKITEIANPAGLPPAGEAWLITFNEFGNTRWKLRDSDGIETVFNQDNTFIVRNDDSVILGKGVPVYGTGSQGNDRLKVQRARADSDTTMPCVGIIPFDIPVGGDKRATHGGVIAGFDTDYFSVPADEGKPIYVSPTNAGQLTMVRPTGATERVQRVGYLINSHPTQGKMLVLIGTMQNNSEPISFITGLQAALDGKSDNPHTHPKTQIDDAGQWEVSEIPDLTASKITDFNSAVQSNRLDQMSAPTASVSMNNQNLTSLAEPVAGTDAATKNYVDATAEGLDVKQSVRVATTANITLSGTQTIDGVGVLSGDRVLVKNQSAPADNGIYVVAVGAWSRSADANTSAEVTAGMFTFVAEGTVNGDQGFVLVTNDPIVLGTTALTFTQFTGAGSGEANTSSNTVADSATQKGLAKAKVGVDLPFKVIQVGSGKISIATDADNVTLDAVTGTGADTLCVGNDARLSDQRTPLDNSVSTIKIVNDAVDNTKLNDMLDSRIKGRSSGSGTGDPEDLTPTQVRTIINVADGATANSSDATLLNRANHTGTQVLATISDVSITATNLNTLDDGVNSTLHFHNTDRDRANHTGTQLLSTISDVTITSTNLNILDDGVNTTLHFHDSDRARANHTGTQLLSTISDVTITSTNLNILDDGVDTTLHFHAADRARANHTGTQALSTIVAFPISKGGTVLDPAVNNIIAWRAPFNCTVTNVRGYRVGGTGATINARRNGTSTHLATAVSLATPDTWVDGGAVQNTAYVAGDKLEIMIVTVTGSPTQVAVQVDFTRG